MTATTSTAVPRASHWNGMSRSVRSMCRPSCAALADAPSAPAMDSTMEPRIENSVLHAPTSMVPTAMGRTTLYQTEYETTSQPAPCPTPRRCGRSGSKNSSSGMRTHHASTPPDAFTADSSGPMM